MSLDEDNLPISTAMLNVLLVERDYTGKKWMQGISYMVVLAGREMQFLIRLPTFGLSAGLVTTSVPGVRRL